MLYALKILLPRFTTTAGTTEYATHYIDSFNDSGTEFSSDINNVHLYESQKKAFRDSVVLSKRFKKLYYQYIPVLIEEVLDLSDIAIQAVLDEKKSIDNLVVRLTNEVECA